MVDEGTARIGVRRGENQRAGAGLDQVARRSAIGDRRRHRHHIDGGDIDRRIARDACRMREIEEAVELQRRAVEHRERPGADIVVGGNAQRAARERGAAGVSIRTGEDQSSRTEFGQSAWPAERLADRECVRRIGDVETAAAVRPVDRARRVVERRAGHLQDAAVEGQRARDVAEIGFLRHRDRSAGKRGAARIGVEARKGHRAGADFHQRAGARGAGTAARIEVGDDAAHLGGEVVAADSQCVEGNERRVGGANVIFAGALDRTRGDFSVAVRPDAEGKVDEPGAVGDEARIAAGAVIVEVGRAAIVRGDGGVAGGAVVAEVWLPKLLLMIFALPAAGMRVEVPCSRQLTLVMVAVPAFGVSVRKASPKMSAPPKSLLMMVAVPADWRIEEGRRAEGLIGDAGAARVC